MISEPVKNKTSTLKRRSRLEIMAKILEVTSQPLEVGKTHIMYQANLSTELTQEYLNFLIEKKFVDVTVKSKRKLFRINDRGRKYIQMFRKIKNLLTV
jgi:predicted transcriptional regulator